MKKLSKRMKKIRDYITSSMQYSIMDGFKILKETTTIKFIESVDVAINLGIDARHSDQNIRNSVIMPNGIGREMRVVVFTQGYNVSLAKEAGADLVGLEDLYDQIKNGFLNDIDVVISSPDVMHVVSKLGSILGPRGLMPNPKMGTVSQNISESVKNFKLGQVRYKNDKNGIIHSTIGKINFDPEKLQENLEALIMSIKQVRPVQCKDTYIEKITVSTTMGGSVVIDKNSFRILIH